MTARDSDMVGRRWNDSCDTRHLRRFNPGASEGSSRRPRPAACRYRHSSRSAGGSVHL